ncbi:MAG TPA: MBL fold metallo-hydrolase [Actinomycetota bacterium]|nr:MBL fold metallo-hydrolase [Actinomycetota bacterium]
MRLEHRRREPAPGVFRLVLPLPFPGLDAVNAYFLWDDDASVLVDCGIYWPDDAGEHGWDDLAGAIAATGHDIADISKLVVTHAHIDHYGMAARVVEATGCELVMHSTAPEDIDIYRDPTSHMEQIKELLADHGVEGSELEELSAFEDWRSFVASPIDPTAPVVDGDKVAAGERTWEVIHTPGHASSHICLWSAKDRIFISGDHLLPTITPHIDFERGEIDPLGDFLNSLKRTEDLDPALVLPGHGRPFEDGAERARVIARHHDRRLGAILQVVRHEPHTANEIVDEIFGKELLNFDRRLALGEALAHLAYLRRRDEVERIETEKESYRYLKKRRKREVEDE